MTTKLEKELRREIEIGDRAYTVTLSPEGIRLTEKGRRKGHELRWADWVSGEAALAVALNASLGEAVEPAGKPKRDGVGSARAGSDQRTSRSTSEPPTRPKRKLKQRR